MNQYILYFLVIINTFDTITMEMESEEKCDAEDSAIAQWYSRVHNFVQVNQNNSQHIQQLHEKLQHLELKTEEINRNLKQCLKDQRTQMAQNGNVSIVLEKLDHLEKEILNFHQNPSGDIVIQRRQDGSVDFYRTWDEYKQGFGDTSGEFFIGLAKLHNLTNSRPYELLIVMEDWENDRRYAKYDQFIVGSEREEYLLKSLGVYSGSAGDSLSPQFGQKFSAKDKDNDGTVHENCAVSYTGAWWYDACHESNLNGRYLKGTHTEYATSVIWYKFKGHHYSLKFVEMTLLPK